MTARVSVEAPTVPFFPTQEFIVWCYGVFVLLDADGCSDKREWGHHEVWRVRAGVDGTSHQQHTLQGRFGPSTT